MCDLEHDITCLHYYILIGDAKIRPKNVCGKISEYCPPEDDVMLDYNGFKFNGIDAPLPFEATIECDAIKKTLGISFAAIAMYFAM